MDAATEDRDKVLVVGKFHSEGSFTVNDDPFALKTRNQYKSAVHVYRTPGTSPMEYPFLEPRSIKTLEKKFSWAQ